MSQFYKQLTHTSKAVSKLDVSKIGNKVATLRQKVESFSNLINNEEKLHEIFAASKARLASGGEHCNLPVKCRTEIVAEPVCAYILYITMHTTHIIDCSVHTLHQSRRATLCLICASFHTLKVRGQRPLGCRMINSQ